MHGQRHYLGRGDRVGDNGRMDVWFLAADAHQQGVGRSIIGTQVKGLARAFGHFAEGDVPLTDVQSTSPQGVLLVECGGSRNHVALDFQDGALGFSVGEDDDLLEEFTWAARRVIGDTHGGRVSRLDRGLGVGDGRAAAACLGFDDEQGCVTRVHQSQLARYLAVSFLENAEVMLALQPGCLGLGGDEQRRQDDERYGQCAFHLFLGDDGALDAQGCRALLAVGLDFDGLLEGARAADGAVGDLDFALLARLDGLGGVFGTCAATRSGRVDDEQRFVPDVGELKGAAHGTIGLLNSAEVVVLDFKFCLGL